MEQKRIIATDDTIHEIVGREIERLGLNADLNHIDVSGVTNMNRLFVGSGFNGDLSKWDVRNVRNMSHMFYRTNRRDFTPLKNWQIHPSCELKDFNDIGKIEFLPPNFHEAFKKTDFKNKIEKLARDARIAKERRKATLNFITVSK